MHYCATCKCLTNWIAKCAVCLERRIAVLEAELDKASTIAVENYRIKEIYRLEAEDLARRLEARRDQA